MPKRISKKKRDVNETASAVVSLAIGDTSEIDRAVLSQVMAAMGRKGGKIGGKRRLETMSPKERSSVARKAAKARWEPKPSKSASN
jgi:hypothetical protein